MHLPIGYSPVHVTTLSPLTLDWIEYYLRLKGFTLPFKDQTLLNRTKY